MIFYRKVSVTDMSKRMRLVRYRLQGMNTYLAPQGEENDQKNYNVHDATIG